MTYGQYARVSNGFVIPSCRLEVAVREAPPTLLTEDRF